MTAKPLLTHLAVGIACTTFGGLAVFFITRKMTIKERNPIECIEARWSVSAYTRYRRGFFTSESGNATLLTISVTNTHTAAVEDLKINFKSPVDLAFTSLPQDLTYLDDEGKPIKFTKTAFEGEREVHLHIQYLPATSHSVFSFCLFVPDGSNKPIAPAIRIISKQGIIAVKGPS